MALSPYLHWKPQAHPTAYIHPSAELLGDVLVGAAASIWPQCVLRGDCGRVEVGADTNVQDGTVAHATRGVSTTWLGQRCTVGHRVTLHGCRVGDDSLVGMGSILLDNVVVGEWCFIAAGSLLTPGKVFPPRSFILGSPARRLREVNAQEQAAIEHSWKVYSALARDYQATPT